MDAEKYIIYGAGKIGRDCIVFLNFNGWDTRIYGFCDRVTLLEKSKVHLY